MRISARNGFAITQVWEVEDAEQRDDEVKAEIGLEIVVRLAAAYGTDRTRTELHLRRLSVP